LQLIAVRIIDLKYSHENDCYYVAQPAAVYGSFHSFLHYVRSKRACQKSPGAANWVIGCKGEPRKAAIPFQSSPFLPEGIYDAHNTPVDPSSLYLAQLSERLGKQAVTNTGY
jgi:hypothetical protein